jgi:TetR/AcrR family transcriptional regulator, mexJK operon transcriptional repressor
LNRRRETISDERRQQIIDGALNVFSDKGFIQATNKDVAEAAGINSAGLIYHYFADKADLLRAVIERYAPPLQLLTQSEEFKTLPVPAALTQFGLSYMHLMDDAKVGACMRVLTSEAIHNEEFAHILGEIGPFRVWRLLAGYLARKMEEGHLRRLDPAIAARCFVGPLVLQMMTRKIWHLTDASDISTEALVHANVEIFVRGMQPEI